MDIQNKSNTYMTNNALPSYEEATSTQPYAPNTNNPEFNPGYPYIVGSSLSTPFPHLSNSYPNSTPIQSTYPQNHPTTVIYRRQLIRRNSEDIDSKLKMNVIDIS